MRRAHSFQHKKTLLPWIHCHNDDITGMNGYVSSSSYEFGCERWPLHFACRTGNYAQVQYLIDTLRFDIQRINEPDDHDATPLYLAALMGRVEICQLLLQRGAICDENDSARVFYVALTPSLRNLLREWSLSAATRDPLVQSWQQHFRSCNPPSTLTVCDESSSESIVNTTAQCVTNIWMIQNESKTLYRSVVLHRIVLQFRCPHLFDQLTISAKEEEDDEVLHNQLPSSCIHLLGSDATECQAMYHILEYLYTGTLDVLTWDTAIGSLNISRSWNLMDLSARLEHIVDQHLLQRKTDYRPTKNTTTHVPDASSDEVVESSFRRCDVLLMEVLHRDVRRMAEYVATPLCDVPGSDVLAAAGSDWTLQCHGVTYAVHRFRWMAQSDFFLRALQGPFAESLTSCLDLSHMVPIEFTEDALPLLIQWMYADCFLHAAHVTIDVAMCVIQLGLALLCPSRLTNYVLNAVIVPNVSRDTVWEMLEFARTHAGTCDRLEEKCCEVIAAHLEDMSEAVEFRQLIVAEAESIRQGGDVNVVDLPLMAEIRRAIHRLAQVTKPERQRKVQLLTTLVHDILRQEQLM